MALVSEMFEKLRLKCSCTILYSAFSKLIIKNKYRLTILLLFVVHCIGCINAKAQDPGNSFFETTNSIIVNIGLFEYNFNYERNIVQKPKSSDKVRLGLGQGMFLTAGEGTYLNAAFIHLFGGRNSHVEIDLGTKIMLTNSISDPKFSEICIPDIFLGYRYEKASGGFIFRAGFNYPTLINIGVGYRF
jgi:hypothetical protein